MLDSISSRLGTLAGLESRKSVAAETVGTPAVPARPAASAAGGAWETGNVTRRLSQSPPVDGGRVAELRQALKAGNYPVQPARIADAMLASLKT